MSEKHLRYAAAAIAFGVIGVVVGYFIAASSSGAAGYVGFTYWLSRPVHFGAAWWFVGAGIVGSVLLYAFSAR